MDSYVLKGFAAHAAFASNLSNVVNPIGELSQLGNTYAREKGIYSSQTTREITLFAFQSESNGVFATPDVDFKNRVLEMIQWVYNKTLTTSGELYADQILLQFLDTFQGKIQNPDSGAMVTDGTYWMPEWLSWHDTTYNAYVRIWFSDDSFRRKFDDFSITVVPPIDHLDDFFKVGADVEALLKSRTATDDMLKVEAAKNGFPETRIRCDIFKYYDQITTTRVLDTSWYILVNGIAGDNIDSIKDAIVNHILSNSTHTRNEWAKILPDIFNRTEFTLVPDWANYAIPERVTQQGIYSPITTLQRAKNIIEAFTPLYTSYHRDNYATTFMLPFKSISVFACSNQENRDQKYLLTDYFPDYIAVGTQSTDFNRQVAATREWSEMIANMISIAETMTEYSDIPLTMTRLNREGVYYLVSSYNNVHYLVGAKMSATNGESAVVS